MEDILAELVGRFRSPAVPEGLMMEKTGPDSWRLNGLMRLDDFRREYPALPDLPEVETMGGLLTHLLGIVPENGAEARFAGLLLKALVTDGRRVRELLARKVK